MGDYKRLYERFIKNAQYHHRKTQKLSNRDFVEIADRIRSATLQQLRDFEQLQSRVAVRGQPYSLSDVRSVLPLDKEYLATLKPLSDVEATRSLVRRERRRELLMQQATALKAEEEKQRRREKRLALIKKQVTAIREERLAKQAIKYGRSIRDNIDHLFRALDQQVTLHITSKQISRYVDEDGVASGLSGLFHYINNKVVTIPTSQGTFRLGVRYNNDQLQYLILKPSNVSRVLSHLIGEGDEFYLPPNTNIIDFTLSFQPIKHKDDGGFIPYYISANEEFDYSLICEEMQILHIDPNASLDTDPILTNCLSYALRLHGERYYVSPSYMYDGYVRKKDLISIANDNLIQIVLHYISKRGKVEISYKKCKDFDPKYHETIHLGIYENHYFKYRNDVITPFGKMNSLRVIETLINEGVMKEMPYQLLSLLYSKIGKQEYDIPFYHDQDVINSMFRPCKPYYDEKYRPDITYICYLDTETDTFGEKHVELVGHVLATNGDKIYMFDYFNTKDALDWLCNLPRLSMNPKEKNVFIVYCHNLRYDASFIVPVTGFRKWYGDVSHCKGFSAYHSVFSKGKRTAYEFRFKDSYAMLPMKLEEFSKSLKLGTECYKLDFPYQCYNNLQSTLNGNSQMNLVEMNKFTKKKDLGKLREAVQRAGALSVTKFPNGDISENVKMLPFIQYYCRLDVKILKEGIEKFREIVYEKWQIDIHSVMTLSSLADAVQRKAGVFDGVYEVRGPIRDYLQLAQHGGRCMVREGKKIHTTTPLYDGDCVSMYPSAEVRLGGYTIGIPKPVVNMTYEDLQNVTSYVVTIDILDVKYPRVDFPMITIPTKNKSKVYDDSYRGRVVVDKTTLESYIEFRGVEFTIIGGYYWDQGRNMKLAGCIQDMFNERLKHPKGTPMNLILKLLLNSTYGKTIQKSYSKKYEIKWYKNAEEYAEYMYNNSYFIDSYVEMHVGNRLMLIIQRHDYAGSYRHYNRCMAGIEVLSTSKLIMFEIFQACQNVGAKVYYSDTDSFIVEASKWEALKQEYFKLYNREFEGKMLGQAHSDFAGDGIGGNKIHEMAVESIFLDRKCYCMKVQYGLQEKTDEGNVVTGANYYYQYRMKGVPSSAIKLMAKNMGVSIMDLYHKMFINENPEYDLLENGRKVRFIYRKDFGVQSVDKFTRKPTFTKPVLKERRFRIKE